MVTYGYRLSTRCFTVPKYRYKRISPVTWYTVGIPVTDVMAHAYIAAGDDPPIIRIIIIEVVAILYLSAIEKETRQYLCSVLLDLVHPCTWFCCYRCQWTDCGKLLLLSLPLLSVNCIISPLAPCQSFRCGVPDTFSYFVFQFSQFKI